MDILKPQLQFIDGICYRINPGNYCQEFDQGTPQPYYEFDSECTGLIEPEAEEVYEIEKDQNGRFITRFHVPKLFFSYIIGSKGATKRRLESETRTTISIPKVGCAGDIVVTGAEKKNVSSARNRVNMLVMSARKKQRPTHFLSLPLTNDVFQQRYQKFKDEVLANNPDMEEAVFQYPSNLHLTIGVLKLCDNIERDQGAKALDYCHKNIISRILGSRRELRVRMQGLDYFNDDPTAVKVLYAKVTSVDEPSLLQNLLDAISEYFVQQGLLEIEKTKSVLIHATLMNSKFSERDESSDDSSYRKTFNIAPIIEVYKDYDFGEACISQVDLSAMHTSSVTKYWQATATIDLFKF